MEVAQGCVNATCCDCWTEGCGLDGAFGQCADCLEAVNPCMEYFADAIWILGSPLAFPCIFFFSQNPEKLFHCLYPGDIQFLLLSQFIFISISQEFHLG